MPGVSSERFAQELLNALRVALLVGIFFILSSSGATAQTIDYSLGFATHDDLKANGNATFRGSAVLLTPNIPWKVGTIFSTQKVDISHFKNTFTFSLTNFGGTGVNGPGADGIIFIIQNNAPTSIGKVGGDLGFVGIGNSVGVKFDIYRNGDNPSKNCTGLFTNGQNLSGGINLNSTGVNLRSGNLLQADMTYDGKLLSVIITDTVTHKSATQSYSIDIPATVNSKTAYIGFGAATGSSNASQQILSWNFSSSNVLIRVDANRDGSISFADKSDQTSAAAPFPFWVAYEQVEVSDDKAFGGNHGEPSVLTEEDGEPDPSRPWDNASKTILFARDLDNFLRVQIQPPSGFHLTDSAWKCTLQLTQVVSGSSAIRVFQADTPGLEYLKDDLAARKLVGKPELALINTSGESTIPISVFAASNRPAALLFEGVATGKAALTVRMYKDGVKRIKSTSTSSG